MDMAWNYYEDFKDDSIENKMLLEHRNLGRVSCGAVLGKGPSVVGQHIHDALMQWYIILPGSKMTYTAGRESPCNGRWRYQLYTDRILPW